MSFPRELLQQDIWCKSKERDEPVPPERIALHYKRAQSICRQSGLSLEDVRYLTKRFWDFHFDLIAARDMTAFIIATIHLNLCIGTLSSFVTDQPYLADLLERLLNFDICGEFMLTEVGHGLDARNLETTATLQQDGSFDLHTPNDGAAKAMPPTTPNAGIPRVAIVFARLMVHGDDRGIKPFVVWLSDSDQMRRGITSRALATRPGTARKPLDHALTTFKHVRLPPKALLGTISKPKDERGHFMQQIWRVSVGTLSLSITGVAAIKVATQVAALYSRRRKVASPDGRERVSIMSFSTQQRPILDGWTSGIVMESYARWTVKEFMDPRHTPPVRHALATVFKATITRACRVLSELSERCGWQGLFAHNQIAELALDVPANSVAEGDILVLCIRLASELLGNKYSLPEPGDPSMALAQREDRLMQDARQKLAELGGYKQHRGQEFNRHLLPRCRPLIEAIGYRMAYEAARDSGVCPKVLRIFELLCLAAGPGWPMSEDNTAIPTFHDDLVKAYDEVLPEMLQGVQETEVNDYITAPIVSDESWASFVEGLPSFKYPCEGLGGYQPDF